MHLEENNSVRNVAMVCGGASAARKPSHKRPAIGNNIKVALLLLLYILEVPVGTMAGNCSCFRCNWRRQGVTQPVTDALKTLVTAQVLNAGGGDTTVPLLAPDGLMFVSTYIPLLGGSLLAFERRSMPPTGDSWNPSPVQYVKLWQQELFTRASLSSPVSALAVGSAVAQAYILIQASGQYVVAVDGSAAKTGFNELWNIDLQDLCRQQQPEEGVCEINVDTSSPTVSPDGGTVYVCTGTTVKGACFALATATGKRKWIYRVSNNGYISSPALSLSGNLMYVPSYQGKNLHVVDAASCSTSSCSALVSPLEHHSSSTPAVADGTGDVYVCAQSGRLLKFNKGGIKLWAEPTSNTSFYCGRSRLLSVSGVPDAELSSPAIIPADLGLKYGGRVVVTGQDWVTRIINADGQVERQFCAHPRRISDSSCAGIALSSSSASSTDTVASVSVTRNGLLLVPAAESFLIAFDLNSEREAWRYRLPEGTALLGAAQAVSAAGELVVASSDGKIHILGAVPYIQPAQARINVEWTFSGVANSVVEALLNSDNVTALSSRIARQLAAEGVALGPPLSLELNLPASGVFVTQLRAARAVRRGDAGSVAIALCVLLNDATQGRQVADALSLPSAPVMTDALRALAASELRVSRTPEGVPSSALPPPPPPPPAPPPPPPASPVAGTPSAGNVRACASDVECKGGCPLVGSDCTGEGGGGGGGQGCSLADFCVCAPGTKVCVPAIKPTPPALSNWQIVLVVVMSAVFVVGVLLSLWSYRAYREQQRWRRYVARRDLRRKNKHIRRAAAKAACSALARPSVSQAAATPALGHHPPIDGHFEDNGGHAVKPYAFYPQDAGGAVSGSVYMPPHPERVRAEGDGGAGWTGATRPSPPSGSAPRHAAVLRTHDFNPRPSPPQNEQSLDEQEDSLGEEDLLVVD